NLAEAVWNTLELYGLKDRIMGVVCDNATNNDTLLESLENRCAAEGIEFSHMKARIRCLPHIVHLSAMRLLEGIGAIKPDSRHGESAYQDSVTTPIDREYDDNAALLDEAEEDSEQFPALQGVLFAVDKLQKIVRSVRSSPQRHKAWLAEVTMSLKKTENALNQVALMLILDVKTRWSSTHQMLRKYSVIICD
ncbi:hypothetical protein EDB19DRAFT_1627207, partial [Suillus lakei]